MIAILLISILALVVSIVLVGRYLLCDLSRLWLKYSKTVFLGHEQVSYYAELGCAIVVTLILAAGAAALKGAVMTLLALCTTGDIAAFTIALRGTFSFTNDIQLPGNHIVMLLTSPLLKMLATLALMQAIDSFFRAFNKRFKGDVFSESDSFYFSSIGVIFLIFIEFIWHAQNVKAFNAGSNMAYLLLDKLFYIVSFLSLYWVKTMRNSRKQLLASMEKYLVMGEGEKEIVQKPNKLLCLTYVVGLLMALPYFLGLQWINRNVTLLLVFVLVLAISHLMLSKLFTSSWNFMGTIVFDATMSNKLTAVGTISRGGRWSKHFRIALPVAIGVAAFVFSVFHPKMMFMFLSISFIVMVGLLVVMALVYGLTLLVGFVVNVIRKKANRESNSKELCASYGNMVLSVFSGLKTCFGAVLIAFMLVVAMPKGLKSEELCANGSIVDTNGDVLYVDTNHDYYCIPIAYNYIPEFFKKALILQEDRCFFDQHDLMINKSNWHGLSFTFLKARGGSNINAQLVKNRTFAHAKGFPRDISRKSADMLGGMMLSEVMTPEGILESYVNIASFHGGRGYRGVNAASTYAFGRPLWQLNKLEQLYLINTLPRNVYMKVGKCKLDYTQIRCDSTNLAKSMLISKAKAWRDAGLITKKEYNDMKNDTLGFTNRPYRCDISIPTRLRLESELDSKSGCHLSYITLENEATMNRAFETLQTKNAYRKNGSELQVASLVVDVPTGHVIAHFSSGVVDFTNYRHGFPIGSLGKPAIITQMLSLGASPNMTLFDGQVGKRKTSKNANHGWTNRHVGITEMLSKSLNAPFNNICDVMNPRTVFLNVERSYDKMGIISEEALCEDTYNYPLGNRQMTVQEVASLYQTLMNDGVHIPLRVLESNDSLVATRIYEARHVQVVKDALSQTIVRGTMKAYRNQLPQGVTYYSKTGTSSGLKDGWNVLSDGRVLIVTWASYGRLCDGIMTFGTEPLYGASSAGLFSVLVYNELHH